MLFKLKCITKNIKLRLSLIKFTFAFIQGGSLIKLKRCSEVLMLYYMKIYFNVL